MQQKEDFAHRQADPQSPAAVSDAGAVKKSFAIHLHHKAPYVVLLFSFLVAAVTWFLDPLFRRLDIPEHWVPLILLFLGVLGAIFCWFYEILQGVNVAHQELYESIVDEFDNQVQRPIAEQRRYIAQYLRKSSAEHKAHINSMANCRFLGESSKIMETLFDATRDAYKVRNTFVCFDLSEDDRGLTQAQIPQARQRIVEFVRNQQDPAAEWTDIVSQDVVHPPVDWLTVWSLCNNLPNQGGKRYHLRRLKESYPIVNFMILEYRGRATEVIFGQGHHRALPGGNVFRTEDDHFVKNFEGLWRELHNDSDPIEHEERRPVAAADIEGIWFRVSYEVPLDWPTDSEHLSPGAMLHDFGLARIRVKNRRVSVTGNLFETSLEFKRYFESVTTDLSAFADAWRLWFSTWAKIAGSRLVSGFYSFSTPSRFGKIDRLSGEYHSQSLPGKKLQIIGFRVSERNFPGWDLGPDPKEILAEREFLEKAVSWWNGDPAGEQRFRR